MHLACYLAIFSNFLIRLRFDLRNNLTVTAFIQIVAYSLKPHKWTWNRVDWHFRLFPSTTLNEIFALLLTQKVRDLAKAFSNISLSWICQICKWWKVSTNSKIRNVSISFIWLSNHLQTSCNICKVSIIMYFVQTK